MVDIVSAYFVVAVVLTGSFVTVVLVDVIFLVEVIFEGRVQSMCSAASLNHLTGHARFYISTAGLLGR